MALRLHPGPRWSQMAKMPARANAKGSGARVRINKNLSEPEPVRAPRGPGLREGDPSEQSQRSEGRAVPRHKLPHSLGRAGGGGFSWSITDGRLRERYHPEQARQRPDEQVPGRAPGSQRAPRGPRGPETRHASVSTLHLRR